MICCSSSKLGQYLGHWSWIMELLFTLFISCLSWLMMTKEQTCSTFPYNQISFCYSILVCPVWWRKQFPNKIYHWKRKEIKQRKFRHDVCTKQPSILTGYFCNKNIDILQIRQRSIFFDLGIILHTINIK